MNSDLLRVASIADTAIDTKAMSEPGESGRMLVTEYLENRDPDLVKAVPGSKVTWFYTRRLRSGEFNTYVRTASTDQEQYQRAFAIGVVKIENFSEVGSKNVIPEYKPDGEGRQGQGSISYFTDDQLDAIAPAFIEEIGAVIWQRSFLAHMPEVSYPPRPSSKLVWANRRYQDAVDVANLARAQSSEPPPEADPTDEPGDADTAATATE